MEENPWSDFLNPDVVKRRFLRAGMFLLAHEMLLRAIKEPLHDFFADTWTDKSGWKMSAAYRAKVLSLDPKGKNDPLRSSIAWLLENDVLTASDEQTIKRLTDERNRFAHELGDVLSGSQDTNFNKIFPEIVGLVEKIERWWIINVEIATDPDFDQDIDEESVVPGSVTLLMVLEKVALGKDEEAWELYRGYTASNTAG